MAGGTRRIVFEVLFKQFSFDATLKKSSELPMPVNQRYPMGDRREMGLRQLKTSHFREPEASRSTGEVGSRVISTRWGSGVDPDKKWTLGGLNSRPHATSHCECKACALPLCQVPLIAKPKLNTVIPKVAPVDILR